MAFEKAAAELAAEIAEDYATKAGGVWSGAVELTAEECRAALLEIVSHAEQIACAEALYAEDNDRMDFIRSCILPGRAA